MHTVVETPEFRAQAKKLLINEELASLINLLSIDPKVGDLIVGTGGFRKLRLAKTGGGKRGGYRVVYFYYDERLPILLASIYAKSEKGDLTQAQRNQLAAIAATMKQTVRRYR